MAKIKISAIVALAPDEFRIGCGVPFAALDNQFGIGHVGIAARRRQAFSGLVFSHEGVKVTERTSDHGRSNRPKMLSGGYEAVRLHIAENERTGQSAGLKGSSGRKPNH